MTVQGVTWASVELDFDSTSTESTDVKVVRTMFFEGKISSEAQICDNARLIQFQKSGLEKSVQDFAIERILERQTQRVSRTRRERYTAVVDLYNLPDDNSGIVVFGPLTPGLTQLMRAAFRRDEVDLSRLLKEGADVNTYNEQGFTALIYAAVTGDAKNAIGLIQYGADVNENPLGKGTALIAAVGSGREEIVRILLKAGADPNIKENGGETALSIAMREKRPALADVLKRAGARTDEQDR